MPEISQRNLRITLKQLSIFDAAARHQSVSKAALEVGLSQPAVTLILQEFERTLGVPLFNREQRRFTLNTNGRYVQAEVRNILRMARTLEDIAISGVQGTLNVGASSMIGDVVLPGIIGDFTAAHPEVQIRLSIMGDVDLIAAVESMVLDVGFAEAITTRRSLIEERWLTEELIIVAGPGHPLRGRPIEEADLAGERWILPPLRTANRNAFALAHDALIRLGSVPLESNSMEAIKRLVASGAGLSCLPRRLVGEEIRQGGIVELNVRDFPISTQTTIILRRDLHLSPLLEAFLENARAFASRQHSNGPGPRP